MRKWLSGRASPCQGEGRGFKSRLSLHLLINEPMVHFFKFILYLRARSSVDRVADFESVRRGFESLRARHAKASKPFRLGCFCMSKKKRDSNPERGSIDPKGTKMLNACLSDASCEDLG